MPTPRPVAERLRKMLAQVGSQEQLATVRATLQSRVSAPRTGPMLDHRRSGTESVYHQAGLEALDALRTGVRLDADSRFALEAIVMPLYRPVVDILNDLIVVDQLQETWKDLGDPSRERDTRKWIRAVGRINVPGLLYAGTAFLVGPDLILTNRHVAALFANGLGMRVEFQQGQSASIGFFHEKGLTTAESATIERVLMIHPWWDLAVLQVRGVTTTRTPLLFDTTDPAVLEGRRVVTIGYPGYDPSDDPDFQRIQERIFRGTYYVKRFQPGILRGRDVVDSYQHSVSTVTHDCSTLGGNSGSAVIDVERGTVVGLHFAGVYLEANYAVSPFDLALDGRIASLLASAGVQFTGRLDPCGDYFGPIAAAWDSVEPKGGTLGSVESQPSPASAQET